MPQVDAYKNYMTDTTPQKIFVPRTVAPSENDIWWSVDGTPSNPCMKRYNGTVLPNCFSGRTQIITDVGVISLKKAYDYCKKHILFVPTIDDEWRKATVKYFGVQEIYQVKLKGSTYYCTGNHRWYIHTQNGYRVVTTSELTPSMKIPYRMCNTDECTFVISVKSTHKSEGVYCVVEPVTRSFTLSGGEITGNCVGYAHGRFSEIYGSFYPGLPTCDGGNWIYEVMNNGCRLTWGSTPKLGAVAVWRNPGKPGHVAIVEYINDDGSIMLSESGYTANWGTRFWNSGPWFGPNWYDSPYQFQGFIYNPATENVKYSLPFSNGIAYGTEIESTLSTYTGPFTYTSKSTQEQNTLSYVSYDPLRTQSYDAPYSSSTDVDLNPIVRDDHPARNFVRSAMLHAGPEGHDWVMRLTGVAKNQGWSAAMCCAASLECGYNDKILPKNAVSISTLGRQIENQYNGSYLVGGFRGGSDKPQVGDIFAISTNSSYTDRDKYSASRIGIVRELAGDTILTVEGDVQGKIIFATRRMRDIAWYVRPDWTRVGGSATCETLLDNPLYSSRSTRADATLREVAFLDDRCEPSITLESTKLSAINYTGILSGIHSVLSQTGRIDNGSYSYISGQYSVDSSQLQPPSARVIFDYLVSKGLSAAQAVGFLANIQQESGFSPSAVNASSGASGICQWLGNRKTEMIKFCGSDWKNNLTGQLDYLWFELNGSENLTLKKLQQEVTGNDESAALQATDIVLRYFERPGHYETEGPRRASNARRIWPQIVVIQNGTGTVSTAGVSGNIVTKSGNRVSIGSTILIPSSIHQAGVVASYSNYRDSYNKWARNLRQGIVAETWDLEGRKSQYYIATIRGYYLVSLAPRFGSVGDVVSVVIEDGTYFNCIIADTQKVESNTSYGTILGDGTVRIIEFESNGHDLRSLITGLTQAGWYGKNILKIVNFGSWIDR